jgi:hypothetical protein
VEVNARDNRRAVFSVFRAVRFVTQRFGKHLCSSKSTGKKKKEAVFSVKAVPRLYNEDLTQLKLELS